jgi:hypothetical protein
MGCVLAQCPLNHNCCGISDGVELAGRGEICQLHVRIDPALVLNSVHDRCHRVAAGP